MFSFWTLTNMLKWKGLLKRGTKGNDKTPIMSQYTLMMQYVRDTHCDGLLVTMSICIWHKKEHEQEPDRGSQKEKTLASSNLPLCIISQQLTACPCFVCCTKEWGGVWHHAQHLHTCTTHLSPPPVYCSHWGKRTTSRAISGRHVPTVQTLGIIKRRWEIEIGNRGRRGGLVSCRDTEGIKNEAAAIFLLFLSKLCFPLHLAM